MGTGPIKIRQMAKNGCRQRPPPKSHKLIIKLLLLLCLSATMMFAHGVTASPDAVKWTKVSIPAQGEAGDWVLAEGSDVPHLTVAGNGTLYAYVKGLADTLYKSTDGGLSWSRTGNVQDAIVGIAVSPHDAGTIYYATKSAVYRSTNGGKTFARLSDSPGGAGANHREITSIDVAWLDNNIVAVGTRDTDSSEYGGVYTLDEANIIPGWVDTGIGSYDAYAVAFSPNYASDRQLIAIVTDETDTFVSAKISDAGWNVHLGRARLNRDNAGTPTPVRVAVSAAIAFPGKYDADATSGNGFYYVAIDTGTGDGDVYKISSAEAPANSAAIDLNIGQTYGKSNIDVTGLAASGDGKAVVLVAGAAASAQTYTSTDSGNSWTRSRKEPTGASLTCVLMAPDFNITRRMYAATSGTGSALSISQDSGVTWNQLSLIDTAVDTIVDLALSPVYGKDSALFLLTFGGEHSLWRSRDGGLTWERVLAGHLSGVDSLNLVGLPPQYGNGCRTVFAAGESSSNPAIWESTDGGQNFRRRFTRDPDTGAAFPIDAWAIANATTLFVASYNGSRGMVYQTANSGFFYSAGVPVGSQSLNSIVLSPSYEQDGTILAANTDGWVFWSDDNGASFRPLPGDATSPPFSGSITIAFDPAFKKNRTIYAASDAADGGIYRSVIGTGSDWESIDGTLPTGTTLNRLAIADDGTLYAANSHANGGMERSLNPTFAAGSTFETVTRGLTDGTTLYGLWLSGHRLWSVDTTSVRLITYDDTLTAPVTPVSPDGAAMGTGSLMDHTVKNVTLDWDTLGGATSYEWQCDYDADFSSVPSGLEGSTAASSVRLPALDPATTYHWRVRASAPVLSPWSEKRSFTTALDTEAIALKPESPAAGAGNVAVKPVFQWTAVAGADRYELLVAADTNFRSPVIAMTQDYALPANVWRCDVSLDYNTTYYWKVRAISTSTRSAWSSAGAFTTESPPKVELEPLTVTPSQILSHPREIVPSLTPSQIMEPVPAPLPPSPAKPLPPAPSPHNIGAPSALSQPLGLPGWIVYLMGGLLVTVILALIVILAMVLKTRRF